ncbi:MAG: hypothetical protein LBC83_04280 [Oscillospiraceae bacterium]|jgi:hypothetical protein|nr:hypothetical protein [Oscillospiraceae bacterium]
MKDQATDLSLSPFDPKNKTTGENGADVPMKDYLTTATEDNIKELLTLYQEALKNGITLSDENKKSIDESIAEIKKSAAQSQTSASVYLTASYTKGINLSRYKKIVERASLAQQMAQKKQDEIKATYPNAKLQEEYVDDPQAFQTVNLRLYSKFATTKLTPTEGETDEALAQRQAKADAEVKAKADAFLAKVTNEPTFIAEALALADLKTTPDYNADTDTELYYTDRSNLETYVKGGEKPIAAWAYAAERKAGDKAVIQTDDHYYVVFMADAPYQLATADYYSIDLTFPTPAEGKTLTEEQKLEVRTQAETLLKQWQDNGGKIENFEAIVAERAKNSSTGSASESAEQEAPTGLTEAAAPSSVTDTATKHWLFNSKRAAMDYDVIETAGGYSFVLFAKQHTLEDGAVDYVWRSTLLNKHLEEDYAKWLKEAIAEYPFEAKPKGVEYALKSAQTMCENYIKAQQAQTDYSSIMNGAGS